MPARSGLNRHYINPAVAVALGVAVLGEPLTVTILAAFTLILAGSVLATQSGLPGRASRRAVRCGEVVTQRQA